MINTESDVQTKGWVDYEILYKSGECIKGTWNNTVLRNGKIALAMGLAREVDDPFSFYVDQMQFGTNGTTGGVPKFVDEARNGLFGPILLSKNVIARVEDPAPTTAIFTSVITFDEAVGSTLNEMALQLANDNLYSMVTFPDLGKTSEMQITFNWRVSLL